MKSEKLNDQKYSISYSSLEARISAFTWESLVRQGRKNILYCQGVFAAEYKKGKLSDKEVRKMIADPINQNEYFVFHFMPTLLPSKETTNSHRILALLQDLPPFIQTLTSDYPLNTAVIGSTYPEVAVFAQKHLGMNISPNYYKKSFLESLSKQKGIEYCLVASTLESISETLASNSEKIEKLRNYLHSKKDPLWKEKLFEEMQS